VEGVIDHVERTGTIGLAPDLALALDSFRSFNFERIYLRPASLAQAAAVVRLLRALVDHLAGHLDALGAVLPTAEVEADPLRAAVGYVAGMTDRFACHLARRELDYPIADLPRGIDIAA
jgi:dGTPase